MRFITIDLECEICGKAFSHQVIRVPLGSTVTPNVHTSSRFFGLDLCKPCDEALLQHFHSLKEKHRAGKTGA